MSTYAGQLVAVRNEDELKKLILLCGEEGCPIIPTSNEGMPPLLPGEENHCVVSLAEMNEVLAFAADDLTITVGVGAKLADLQRIVGAVGQRLAIEVPNPESSPIGSILGMGSSGFLGSTLGSLADQVLGIEAIVGDGRRLVGGGQVVKNVTGYDFVRLFCGSTGSLGIITQATFRLRPLPLEERSFVLETKDIQDAIRMAHVIRGFQQTITALVIVDGQSTPRTQETPLLLVRSEGSPKALESLNAEINELAKTAYTLDQVDSELLWQQARQFPLDQDFHLKLKLPPSKVEACVKELLQRNTEDTWGLVCDMQAATISWTLNGDRDVPTYLQSLEVRELENRHMANACLPDDLADREGRWDRFTHPEAAARKIGDRIKITFDPAGIFLPIRPIAGSF